MSQTVQQKTKWASCLFPNYLFTMSLPMMISMLVQALYNIVDSMFVAKLCEEALTAVSLAFPIQTLMICSGIRNRSRYQCIAVKELRREEFQGRQHALPATVSFSAS